MFSLLGAENVHNDLVTGTRDTHDSGYVHKRMQDDLLNSSNTPE